MGDSDAAVRPRTERIAWDHILIIGGTHALAVVALFYPSKDGLIAFLIAHFVTGLFGATIGNHRLLSHGSFRTSHFLRGVFAYLGVLNMQGGPITWSTFHRSHHLYNDALGDPHSSARGFFWSHLWWMFYRSPNGFSHFRGRALTRDLNGSRWLRFLDRRALEVNVATAFLVYLIVRRVDVVLWAFPLRIVVFWHCTWLVNSYCHGAVGAGGTRSVEFRNSFWVSLLTYGDGWHANHHLRPDTYTQQFKWWQLDPGNWTIRAMLLLGIARPNRKARKGRRLGKEHRVGRTPSGSGGLKPLSTSTTSSETAQVRP